MSHAPSTIASEERQSDPPYKSRSPWRDVPFEQWSDWRWQLRHRITSAAALAEVLDLDEERARTVDGAAEEFAFGIPPYYAALIDPRDPACPIRRMSVPLADELAPAAFDMSDPLNEEGDLVAPGMTHRYPDRVLWTLTHECAMFCRYCTRKRKVGEAVSLASDGVIDAGIKYLQQHPEVRDVVFSGGDPFLLPNERIEHVLQRLRDEVPSVQIVRFGSRTPATMPQRITPELVEILRRHHPVYVNVHFNVPQEFTQESEAALARLADAGIPLGNQSVLLAGINDCSVLMKQLVYDLTRNRVRPYYIYQCDLSRGLEHFRTTVAKGVEIIESLRGHVSGLAVPTFVVDAPGGGGKIPLMPNYLVSMHEHKVILRNYEGRIVSYEEPREYVGMCSDGDSCPHCTRAQQADQAATGVAGLFDDDPENIALTPASFDEETAADDEQGERRR
jgi:lysine 2,3-aminomutase